MIKTESNIPENFLEEICKANIVGAKITGDYIYVSQPTSEREAENLASFWYPLFDGKKFLRKLGIKIEPTIKDGEIKMASLNPELIRYYNKQTVKFILNENEWRSVNKLAENSNTFNAPFAMLPENLCYQVDVPLECITRIEFKEKN